MYLYRKVTSWPFSRIPGNRNYRYIVCSVEVSVVGNPQRLPEVQDALGNAPIQQLVLKQVLSTTSKHTSTSTCTSISDTSTPHTSTFVTKEDDSDSDKTIIYELSSPDETISTIDCDKTVLPYDSDETVLPYDSDETVLPYDSDETVLPYDSDETVLPYDSDETVLPSDSDETVLPYDNDETVLPSDNDETVLPYDSDETVLPSDNDETVLPYDSDETVLQHDNDRCCTTPDLFSEPDSSTTPLIHLTNTPPLHVVQQFQTSERLHFQQLRSYNMTPPLKRTHTTQTISKGRKRLRIHKRT